MSQDSVDRLEREVESSRQKLAHDLAVLRSPTTMSDFTSDLKQDALDARDVVIDKAKTSVRTAVEGFVEDVKAKAAANPAAALAIGAGLAWQLIRKPPIATTLIGAGLVSLLRTSPARLQSNGSGDHLAHAKMRLKEQVSDATQSLTDQAAVVGGLVKDKVSETAVAAKEQIGQWTAESQSAAKDFVKASTARAGALVDQAAEAMEGMQRSTMNAATATVSGLGIAADEWSRPVQRTFTTTDSRDQALLGAAGLAVVAALSIAWQRRGSPD